MSPRYQLANDTRLWVPPSPKRLMLDVPPDCTFAPRCWKAQEQCRSQHPELAGEIPSAACFFPEE
ncbi:MAG: hypothetical protein VW995_14105 [Deltaproteobacteria bacterium]